ncbi:hypothetical protein [Mycobacteroides abscessus]|uniref:hypothetical protein n=1 Tax=Mycobacteroides abscessus TaxID=36809 RepID=UPI000929BD6A|nr:hypothetical protein [Mycobacteroides abscessus]SIA17847.1 Uncharacterised protein [Mycobacteroides abscessus subsp. abscessus]
MGKGKRNRKERNSSRAPNDTARASGFMEATFGDLLARGALNPEAMSEVIEIIPVARTVREALGSAHSALVDKRPEKAIAAAEQLGDYLQGRGWVFDGNTSDLESVSWTFEARQGHSQPAERFDHLTRTRLTADVAARQIHGEYITAIWITKPGADDTCGPRKILPEQLIKHIEDIEA